MPFWQVLILVVVGTFVYGMTMQLSKLFGIHDITQQHLNDCFAQTERVLKLLKEIQPSHS